jgi:hypothetical protein
VSGQPKVTANWQAVDSPSQYQALLRAIFGDLPQQDQADDGRTTK